MEGFQDVASWLKVAERAIPEVLGSAELILARVAFFVVFLLGLWKFVMMVVRAHRRGEKT